MPRARRAALGRRLAILAALAALSALTSMPAVSVVPGGFRDDPVATVGAPTALAFTPDGRLLVTTQGGTLRVVANGALLPTPALSFAPSQICTESERGLLGVAVDPNFAGNSFIYLFYTFAPPGGGCVNRVSRFTLPPGNVVDPASELVLIDNMPSPAGNHNGGDLQFGKDGHLYVTIGDGGCDYAGNSGCAGANDAARDLHVLTGKVLRITPGGGIPATNPFLGAGTARCNVTGQTTPGIRCQETFAWGLRNPFRLGFDPNDAGTRFFVNDVGQGLWEEIDLGQAGVDYGWNCREGAHTNSTIGPCSPTPPGMVDPIFEYAHGTQIPGTTSPSSCNCVSGGAFVPDGLWPGHDGAYLFGDCTCGGIFRLDEAAGVFSAGNFAAGLGTVVHLAFGPYRSRQALYYTTFAGGGQVRRIVGPVGPLDFHTVAPCRLADTRNPPGPSGGPALAAGSTRAFQVAGLCGVPATAEAVAVNVTVTSPNAAGNLVLFPGGSTAPATSTINFVAGQTRANNATVELGAVGDLGVSCTMPGGGAVHFVLDVTGYYE
jgi:glucose/arabinose dehydrogenase